MCAAFIAFRPKLCCVMTQRYQWCAGFLAILLCVVLVPDAAAQRTVTGRVLDASTGETIPGANVRIAGTTSGTTTNVEGRYEISVSEDRNRLVFSFVGYKSKTVELGEGETELDVQLEEDVLGLEEVVVTGLATSVQRRNVANSVGTIKQEELVPVPAQTLERALSGKIAGLTVSQNTGAPGGGINVNLRGTSTITGSTQPLYVVDGVIIDNSAVQPGLDRVTEAAGAGSDSPQGQPTNRVADLNPNDIESIEVLKGASASAIYGAKATNGVIIITTKSGRAGETRVNITQQVGFNTILNKIGTRDFRGNPDAADEVLEGEGAELVEENGYIDYEELVYGREGLTTETTVGISGGDEDTRFYVSALGLDEQGIIENTGYSKYSAKVNVEQTLSEKLRVRVNSSLIRSESDRSITGNENQGATTLGFSVAFTPSFIDLRQNPDGTYPNGPGGSNPLQTVALLKNNEVSYRGLVSGLIEYGVFQKERQSLDAVIRGGVDAYSLTNEVVSPPALQFEEAKDLSVRGVSLAGETTSLNTNIWANLVHRFGTESGINLTTTGGIQYETKDLENVLTLAEGLIETQENIDQATTLRGFEDVLKQRELGVFVQEEVDIQEKYFLTVGLRADASSRVGDTEQFFLYPKFAGSVQLASFDFWEPLDSALPQFKIRAAFGRTGNLPQPGAKYTSLVAENVSGVGGVLVPTRRGNPDIEPETTQELEAGIDLAFLNELGTLDITYYRQNIQDLILENALPPSSGYSSEFINAGDMRTTGIEVTLDVIPVDRPNWGIQSTLSFGRNRSEITSLDVDPFQLGGFSLSLGQFRIAEGLSPTTIVGLNETGDLTVFGNSNANFQVGWSGDVRVRDFSFGFLWDWKEGGDVINLGKLITDLARTTPDLDTEEGQARRAGAGGTGRYVEDGTYLKLREATLSYTVPESVLQRWFSGTVRNLNLGIGGRNLLMFTPYDGYDPEVSQFGNVAVGRAVDVIPFPSSRNFYFKVGLGF